MAMYDTTTPDLNEISIIVGNSKYDRFLSYNYEEDYLSPSDRWSFSLDQDELTDEDLTTLTPRALVSVTINGKNQSVGFIDSVHTSVENGTVVTISGRDWLSPAVDGHIDPRTSFVPSMTLLDLINTAFASFGMTAIATDNIANRNSITGRIYGNLVSKKGKALKSYGLHQLKPYQGESVFSFASRISQRFGLWIRPSATYGILLVTAPDYDTATNPARYSLVHKANGAASINNNVQSSDVTWNAADMPSCILASGFSTATGAEFSYSGKYAGIINPIMNSDISKVIANYPTAQWAMATVPTTSGFKPFTDRNARPLFMYDSESHDIDQLQAFVRRQMSMCFRRAFNGRYSIMGHTLGGQPLAVDTQISIDDDRSNLHQTCWILNRRFSKSSSQGTTTTIEVTLPGAITF